jgi:RNA polymerase sigma-70 factor (ECF subfamily)
MGGTADINRTDASRAPQGFGMAVNELDLWFVQEVLPLEGVLMQFLRRNWRNESDLPDLCQDVYIRVYEAAKDERPDKPKSFLLTTARNLMADRVRRERIVPIEAVGDVDTLNAAIDEPGPERVVAARDELRVLQEALDQLPKRCREAVILKQIEGLSRREIALRMGVGEETVKQHLTNGMYALADILSGKPADLRKKP